MENNITTDLLKLIFERAEQYAIAKYNKSPDYIRLDEDGDIRLIYEYRDCCGGWDTDYYDVKANELNSDLDTLIKERKEIEEKQRIADELKREKDRIETLEREKRNRYAEFLKLKKEFDAETN